MKTIAMLTDFGTRDWYVASMKGLVLQVLPDARIIDISHQVRPGHVRNASFLLEQCYRDFPAETVFLAVVDPGVGTERRAVAIRRENYTFVGPDNGLFAFVQRSRKESEVREITNPWYMRELQSHTFHGRDIFAPAAARLAAGEPFEKIGPELRDLVGISLTAPEYGKRKVLTEVAFVDHFGNIITAITREAWKAQRGRVNKLRLSKEIIPITDTYGDVKSGETLAYFGSGDYLEIAVNGGNAAEHFGVLPGSFIKLMPVED